MKKIALAVLAALVAGLAGCSNASDDSLMLAALAGGNGGGSGSVREAETWPQITPVDFDVDLEGFEECPKDEVYGINWVFVRKLVVDEKWWREKHFKGEDFRLKPVEFHKSNPAGVEFGSFPGGTWRPDEGAYKCVAYRKPGDAGKSFERTGCDFHYIPDGDDGYYSTESLEVTRVASRKTKVSGGERFREVYKY
ncbi:MAG: hypothetical protein II610_00790 [Treponema sp.]|nr:hypothetical protein [Treponema sp.]